jgi:hypothetical protein
MKELKKILELEGHDENFIEHYIELHQDDKIDRFDANGVYIERVNLKDLELETPRRFELIGVISPDRKIRQRKVRVKKYK